MKMKQCLPLLTVVGTISWANAQTSSSPFYPENLYGWYEVGPTLVEDTELREFFGAPAANDVEINPGFHFGIGIGQELCRFFKVEVESGFKYNSIDSISGATMSSGDLYRVPLLANAVLQFPNRTGITPMIGAGIGGQWLHLDADSISIGGTTVNDDSDTWVFNCQGFAGVSYDINHRFNIGVFYRFNYADGPSWEFNSLPGNLKMNDLRTHSIALTLGWWF